MARLENALRRCSSIPGLSLVFCLLLAGTAMAAGGQDGGGGASALIDLGKRLLNFALLVIILGWVIKKSGIRGFFSTRTEEIGQKLEDLKREKEEAENRYRDTEKRLREFEASRKDIVEQYTAEGMAEKERIVADARERVKGIIAQAELTIQQEIHSAKDRLKQEVVNLAAQKAQEIITKKLTDKDQDHLVNDFIERVGKLH